MQKRMGCLALFLAMVFLSGCGAEEPAAVPELQEPVGVQPDTAVAYIGDIYDITYYDSAVVPYVEELSFAVDGSVAAIHFYPGMSVAEGDVLVELDRTDLEERAAQLRSELEYAQRNYAYSDTLAQLDIDYLQVELGQLKEQGAAEQEIQLKENEIAQKRAALRQSQELRELDLQAKQQELDEISASLDKYVLRAPFSGRILYSDELTEESRVAAYDPILFLSDDSQLHLSGEYIADAWLTNADRLYAHIGENQYEIAVRPVDQQEHISSILAGETLTTEFDILGPEEYLGEVEAGEYAAICVCTNYVEDALLVPSGAVLQDATGSYIYVDEDGTRVRRMVRLGHSTDALVQIVEGLEEGEVVYVKE